MQLVSRGKRRRTMDFALGCSTWNSLEHAIRYHSIPVPRGIMAPVSIGRSVSCSTWNNVTSRNQTQAIDCDNSGLPLFHVEQRRTHLSIGILFHVEQRPTRNQTQAINCDNFGLPLFHVEHPCESPRDSAKHSPADNQTPKCQALIRGQLYVDRQVLIGIRTELGSRFRIPENAGSLYLSSRWADTLSSFASPPADTASRSGAPGSVPAIPSPPRAAPGPGLDRRSTR